MKCLIVDEADAFFYDDKTFASLKKVCDHKDIAQRDVGKKVQKILFSATFVSQDEATTDKIQKRQSEIIGEAGVKPNKLKSNQKNYHLIIFNNAFKNVSQRRKLISLKKFSKPVK